MESNRAKEFKEFNEVDRVKNFLISAVYLDSYGKTLETYLDTILSSCNSYPKLNHKQLQKIELEYIYANIFLLWIFHKSELSQKANVFCDSTMFEGLRAEFINTVHNHIETYTIPQYGDMPGDQIEEWSPAEIIKTIRRRVLRFGKSSRDESESLDIYKMAHECCMAYMKIE